MTTILAVQTIDDGRNKKDELNRSSPNDIRKYFARLYDDDPELYDLCAFNEFSALKAAIGRYSVTDDKDGVKFPFSMVIGRDRNAVYTIEAIKLSPSLALEAKGLYFYHADERGAFIQSDLDKANEGYDQASQTQSDQTDQSLSYRNISALIKERINVAHRIVATYKANKIAKMERDMERAKAEGRMVFYNEGALDNPKVFSERLVKELTEALKPIAIIVATDNAALKYLITWKVEPDGQRASVLISDCRRITLNRYDLRYLRNEAKVITEPYALPNEREEKQIYDREHYEFWKIV
ncbi:MAG: hypothetical protein LBO72_02685 [Helicobacteraceae bacterium]|jgi:hypothetical protein|nr:hypothetical protein [Helicobacteraceae bacterium]